MTISELLFQVSNFIYNSDNFTGFEDLLNSCFLVFVIMLLQVDVYYYYYYEVFCDNCQCDFKAILCTFFSKKYMIAFFITHAVFAMILAAVVIYTKLAKLTVPDSGIYQCIVQYMLYTEFAHTIFISLILLIVYKWQRRSKQ